MNIRSIASGTRISINFQSDWAGKHRLRLDPRLIPRKNQGKTIRCTVITSIGSSIDHPLPVPRELMESVLTEMLKASASG